MITAYELKNIAILNKKGFQFRCILWDISRDDAVNWLNNSVLEVKEFDATKMPIEVIKEF